MKERANTNNRLRVRRVAIGLFCILGASIGAWLIASHRQESGELLAGMTADRIVVEKSARKLSVYRNGKVCKVYRIALGRAPIGAKQQEGDIKTPEGHYTIDYRNPNSDFHLALHISYPSPDDQARAAARGLSAGGDVMIHGVPNGSDWIGSLHRQKDWTAGCIALTDQEIEELWQVVPDGTPIEIAP